MTDKSDCGVQMSNWSTEPVSHIIAISNFSFRLKKAKVLITPLNGIMCELAKNLVLAGVNLVLHDDVLISAYDLENNFLFADEDIGKPVKRTILLWRAKLFVC